MRLALHVVSPLIAPVVALALALALVLAIAAPAAAGGDATLDLARPPDRSVDLRTPAGAALAAAEWRYHDARLAEVDFRSPGADRKPSGPPNRTYEVEPRAGAADFDDSAWPVIDPASLEERRSTGKVCFAWYRLSFTVPETVGDLDLRGAAIVFETVVDDYAEVWVDGRLPRELGQSGGAMVAGFNTPNRLVVVPHARPGQRVKVAIFAMNGPLSDAPPNYIWMRSAKLDVYRLPRAVPAMAVKTEVDRLDPALDRIVPAGARIEKLAEGFEFTEGPVWSPEGYLLFSDPNANTIYRLTPDGELTRFRERSGYQGADIGEYKQPGSNGLTFDAEGRLLIDEHGNHRLSRLEPDGSLTVLADSYRGRRLNSPNDLVVRSDGAVYFTDPPFGLPRFDADARKELPYSGIYRFKDGQLRLLDRSLAGPNGIAFSPDEKHLYVGNWDPQRKVVMRWDVSRSGDLGHGIVFADLGAAPGEEAIDGVKVDREGNVYVSGPGGLWIFSPAGKALGTIRGPELAANFAWGDVDGRTLYLTARGGVYRLRLLTPGVRPEPRTSQVARGR